MGSTRAALIFVTDGIHRPAPAAIGSCDDEYGALLNGNRSGGLGSRLVKVPGLFCIQRIMHARK